MTFLHEIPGILNSIVTVAPVTLVLYDYGRDMCRSFVGLKLTELSSHHTGQGGNSPPFDSIIRADDLTSCGGRIHLGNFTFFLLTSV